MEVVFKCLVHFFISTFSSVLLSIILPIISLNIAADRRNLRDSKSNFVLLYVYSIFLNKTHIITCFSESSSSHLLLIYI